MTIRRQYSLPNCTLILEGLSDGTSTTGQPDPRPLMSILVNAECHIAGQQKPITGGRDFLESLVTCVSEYAQECLSGVPHQASLQERPSLVHLHKKNGENLHRLTVQPAVADTVPAGSSAGHTSAMAQTTELVLTTVQLFDLVEAVDQFLADSRTLPDLSLRVRPVSKRYAAASEPMAKRAAPVLLGATSLAALAIAFSLVPVPKVEPPTDLTPQPTASPTPTPSPTPSTASAADLEALLASAPEINNPTQLRFLQRKVYRDISQSWQNRSEVGQNLIYRVGVSKDGSILGYKPVGRVSDEYAKATPLAKLLYIPTTSTTPSAEPIGQFKVVFTEKGVLEVSPWWGYKSPPSLGPQITDADQLKTLIQQLRDQIRPNWQGISTYKRNLVYRVAMTKDGVVTDYEPVNQAAFDYVKQTPIPSLVKPSNSADVVPQEPLGQFKVVLKPTGTFEIGRW